MPGCDMNQTKFLLTRSQLLEQLKDDENQKDWTVFFNTYWKFIYNICRKAGLSDADAQDVVQETMLTVARKIKEFNYERKKGYFKNWLKVITRSRIQDHWRKQNRRLPEKKSNPEGGEENSKEAVIPDPKGFELEQIWEQEWQDNLYSIALERVREHVSAKQFQIFDCYVVKEWSVKDIKRKLGFSSPQIYTAKYRVGKLLKQELEQLMEENL